MSTESERFGWSGWNQHFHGEYLAARAYLFSKVFLCMLAFDTWTLMLGHAGRYGVANFNVSHFPFVDGLLPVPTPTLYIGVLLLTGLLSLTLALIGPRPTSALLLFALYTYSWSMSMLDSYQHHYFVSLVLLCLPFFPRVGLAELAALTPPTPAPASTARGDWLYLALAMLLLGLFIGSDETQRAYLWLGGCALALLLATWLHARRTQLPAALTQGFGYPLLATTVAVLYTFTAVAKMDAQWCAGFTLRRIASAEQLFAPLLQLAQALGISPETFWPLASMSVIPLELLIAAGYLLSARQDVTTRRWQRWCCNLTFPLALSLHVGAEALRLDIGWFSYYMIALAFTFLLPGRAVTSLSRLVSLPAQQIARLLAEPAQRMGSPTRDLWLACAAVSGVLAAVGYMIDLPGAAPAAVLGAAGLIGYALRVGKRRPDAAQHAALAVGVSAVLMWTAIVTTEARWDYYRYLGGDLQRRGQSREALEAYLKGERYAPKGSSRRTKIRELQRELGLPVSP